VIFGLIITSGNADADFRYWDMEELDDKDSFDSYVATVESKNMIDNPLDVQFGDSILTLSTCYSDEDNSRFLVVARRLRDGEDTDTLLKTIQGEDSTATEE
jgi:sortase B